MTSRDTLVTTSSVVLPGGTSLLCIEGIGKRYGASWVLQDVDLQLQPGQVVALLGENGAGKSTLVKILSGAVSPDAGRIALAGEPLPLGRPDIARRAGVAIVYQELSVCPDLSVADNVMLGSEMATAGWINKSQQLAKVRQLLATLGHPDLDPLRPVGSLSVGAQQLVEIARALVLDAKILVLDEPTSSLAQSDVKSLFAVIGELRKRGMAIIYISHFLEEIRQICDSYCVLRDGRVAGQGKLDNVAEKEIVRLMVGRDVNELFPKVEHEVGEPVLRLENVAGLKTPKGVTLEIGRGEIFGIAGLVGAGRTELLRTLFGLDPVASGTVSLSGNPLGGGPASRIARGLGLLSEDRKGEGLAQAMSVRDNLTLSHLAPYRRGGVLLDEKRRGAAVDRWIREVSIKVPHGDAPISSLSGGNQQKVAFARLLHQEAEILLLDEPTRGIDVGTKAEIYRWIGTMAEQGKTILFVSSYFQELLQLCDRIALLSRGKLVDVRTSSAWSEASLMHAAMSGSLELEEQAAS